MKPTLYTATAYSREPGKGGMAISRSLSALRFIVAATRLKTGQPLMADSRRAVEYVARRRQRFADEVVLSV